MPHLTTDDGVKLYYEETGKGIPVVFVHEFAGDCRSWEQQVRHFGRRIPAEIRTALELGPPPSSPGSPAPSWAASDSRTPLAVKKSGARAASRQLAAGSPAARYPSRWGS